MKKATIILTVTLIGYFFFSGNTVIGQTSGQIVKQVGTTYPVSKLFEYYPIGTGMTPRLLFPYNSTGFSTTDFLVELLVDNTKTSKGFRLSNASNSFAFELLSSAPIGTTYGIYQKGTNFRNYFESSTAIGGTQGFQPLTTLHVKGDGLFTTNLGIGINSAPAATLQIASTDSVTFKFEPGRTFPVSFNNTSEASPFQFWTMRDNNNPIDNNDEIKSGEMAGYSRILAFAINPNGQIESKSAVFQNSVTTNTITAYNVVFSQKLVSSALRLSTGAREGKILVSDNLGNASWLEPAQLQTTTSYWKLNASAKTIYTDSLKVGILTSNVGSYTLAVNGIIGCKELKIETSSSAWPDYVFSVDYHLPSLKEVEQFVKTFRHLPELPSAEKIENEGIDIGKMQATLLKKIEELTLYLIEQQKIIDNQQEVLTSQQEQISHLKAILEGN
ncbi:MAG: hypothetical protein LWX70_15170 [Sphingobacteriia bacterium]|nr:hypothetical protein [Sphingobacteriia bacterium]